MSTLKINTLSNVAGTQSTAVENAINGSAKAWVNFNGTGTVAIRASYNVSSITDNGTGDYTVNLTTAMSDANYCPINTLKPTSGASSTNSKVANIRYDTNLSTSSYRIWTTSTGGAEDMDIISSAIFR